MPPFYGCVARTAVHRERGRERSTKSPSPSIRARPGRRGWRAARGSTQDHEQSPFASAAPSVERAPPGARGRGREPHPPRTSRPAGATGTPTAVTAQPYVAAMRIRSRGTRRRSGGRCAGCLARARTTARSSSGGSGRRGHREVGAGVSVACARTARRHRTRYRTARCRRGASRAAPPSRRCRCARRRDCRAPCSGEKKRGCADGDLVVGREGHRLQAGGARREYLGDAEVEQLHRPASARRRGRAADIRRFRASRAMHHAGSVRSLQAGEELTGDVHRLRPGSAPRPAAARPRACTPRGAP